MKRLKGLMLCPVCLSALCLATARVQESDTDLFTEARVALEKFHDCKAAVDALDEVSAAGKKDPIWIYYAAKAKECAGALEESLALYRQYDRAVPGKPEIQDKIGELEYKLRKSGSARSARENIANLRNPIAGTWACQDENSTGLSMITYTELSYSGDADDPQRSLITNSFLDGITDTSRTDGVESVGRYGRSTCVWKDAALQCTNSDTRQMTTLSARGDNLEIDTQLPEDQAQSYTNARNGHIRVTCSRLSQQAKNELLGRITTAVHALAVHIQSTARSVSNVTEYTNCITWTGPRAFPDQNGYIRSRGPDYRLEFFDLAGRVWPAGRIRGAVDEEAKGVAKDTFKGLYVVYLSHVPLLFNSLDEANKTIDLYKRVVAIRGIRIPSS